MIGQQDFEQVNGADSALVLGFRLCELDVVGGVAFSKGIESHATLKVIFGCVELDGWTVHTRGNPGEFYFAICVGAGLKIEFADPAESVGDVHLDGGVIDRLAVRPQHSERKRTRPSSAIYDWNLRGSLRLS